MTRLSERVLVGKEDASGSSNVGIIVGPVAGGLVLLVLIVWCCRRRHTTPQTPLQQTSPPEKPSVDLVVHDDYVEVVEHDAYAQSQGEGNNDEIVAVMKHMHSGEGQGDADVKVDSILEANRLPDPVVLLEAVLGRGTYGEVILGHYNDSLVAVKRLRPDHNNAKNIRSLVQEIELMTRFNSPFLVHFIGATWTTPDMSDLMCVVEYMEMRDLQTYLAKSKMGPKKTAKFSWPQKMACARQMALALVYLHDQKVIHRDLKSPNVFLNQAMDAKLGDFGIARQVVEKSMSNAVGTYRWTAPEVLKGKYYTVKADVYSFGMVLSELDTHVVPYYGMTNAKGQELGNFTIMFQVMNGAIKPAFSTTCPPWLHSLALRCIEFDPALRPSAQDIVREIQEQEERLPLT